MISVAAEKTNRLRFAKWFTSKSTLAKTTLFVAKIETLGGTFAKVVGPSWSKPVKRSITLIRRIKAIKSLHH